MTIPPLPGGAAAATSVRVPVLTGPVSGGVSPLGDPGAPRVAPEPAGAQAPDTPSRRDDAPIALAGRLETGDLLPETTALALSLESATRLLHHGRAHEVLEALDAVWSDQLEADSPWYLRAAALQLLGRQSDTEVVLRNAIARLPRSAAMLYLLGVHTAERGHLDAARLASQHALALHPTEPLLRLQSAALSLRSVSQTAIDVLLAEIRAQDPGVPSEIWLATLVRLHDGAERPTMPADTRRLTPRALRSLDDTPSAPSIPRPSHEALESALRYGLSLLDSPTQSARLATRAAPRVPRASDASLAAVIAGAEAIPPARATVPTWESLLLLTAVGVMALVPPMRLPALLLAGVAALALAARRLR